MLLPPLLWPIRQQVRYFSILGGEAILGQKGHKLLPAIPALTPQQIGENRVLFLQRDETGHDVLRREISEVHVRAAFDHIRVLRFHHAVGVERNPVAERGHIDQPRTTVGVGQGLFPFRIEDQQADIRRRGIKLGHEVLD